MNSSWETLGGKPPATQGFQFLSCSGCVFDVAERVARPKKGLNDLEHSLNPAPAMPLGNKN
jgi:hypothetical protein